jgi:hypothetical protein
MAGFKTVSIRILCLVSVTPDLEAQIPDEDSGELVLTGENSGL